MVTNSLPCLPKTGPFGGANSLEGSLADHLAFCASWLANERYTRATGPAHARGA